jgi:peptidoglycan L-alanyl-D-glutamate endopeptidase CwlK
MPSRDLKDLDSKLVNAYNLAKGIYANRFPNEPQPFITCTHRSNEEQNQLYAIGRTVKGKIVTNAKAGQSKHNSYPSKAFDIAFIGLDKKLNWNKKYFKMFADIVKEVEPSIVWGGNFKSIPDAPHYEL